MKEWLSEHKGAIVVVIWLVVMVIMADHYYNFGLAEKAASFIHNVNPVVDDCGNDAKCFQKHLEFCEKAIYKPKKGTILLKMKNKEIQATENTVVEIKEALPMESELEKQLAKVFNTSIGVRCKVFYKDVNRIIYNAPDYGVSHISFNPTGPLTLTKSGKYYLEVKVDSSTQSLKSAKVVISCNDKNIFTEEKSATSGYLTNCLLFPIELEESKIGNCKLIAVTVEAFGQKGLIGKSNMTYGVWPEVSELETNLTCSSVVEKPIKTSAIGSWNCYFETNSPNSDEYKVSVSFLECRKARE